MNCWIILDIEPTKDEKLIKKAYSAKSKLCHPEENPERFAELKQAYQEAIAYSQEEPEQVFFPDPLFPFPVPEQLSPSFSPFLPAQKGNLFEEESVTIHIPILTYEQMYKQYNEKKSYKMDAYLLQLLGNDYTPPKELSFTDYLLQWVYSNDFLDHYQEESFIQQLKIIIKDLHHGCLPLELEAVLCMVYGCNYALIETYDYHFYLETDREFEAFPTLSKILQSYSQLSPRDLNRETGILSGELPLHQKGFEDYCKLKHLVSVDEEGFSYKEELMEIFSPYLNLTYTHHKEETDTPQRHPKSWHLLLHFIENHPVSPFFLFVLKTCLSAPYPNEKADPLLQSKLFSAIEKNPKLQQYEQYHKELEKTKELFYAAALSCSVKKNPITISNSFASNYPPSALTSSFDTSKLPPETEVVINEFLNAPLKVLLDPLFFQENIMYGLVLNENNFCERNLVHPLFIESLINLYKNYSNPILNDLKSMLESALYSSRLSPYFFLNQPKTPEKVSFPEVFHSEDFWIYFFSLTIYSKYAKEITFLHVSINFFPINLPWVYDFTQFNIWEQTQSHNTTYSFELAENWFTLLFQENHIYYFHGTDCSGEEITAPFLSIEALEIITEEHLFHALLLLPFVQTTENNTLKNTILDYLQVFPLSDLIKDELSDDIVNYICSSTKIRELHRNRNERSISPLSYPTKTTSIQGLTPDIVARILSEQLINTASGRPIPEYSKNPKIQSFYEKYHQSYSLTLSYGEENNPCYFQPFHFKLPPSEEESLMAWLSTKKRGYNLSESQIPMGELGFDLENLSLFGMDTTNSNWFIKNKVEEIVTAANFTALFVNTVKLQIPPSGLKNLYTSETPEPTDNSTE